jgi:hypothetical protein
VIFAWLTGVLQPHARVQARLAGAPLRGDGVAAGDLVGQEQLEEPGVAEAAGGGQGEQFGKGGHQLAELDLAQQRPQPARPLRSLPFGPGGEGLVTFLVYEPDELVLVTRVQWLGDLSSKPRPRFTDRKTAAELGNCRRRALTTASTVRRDPMPTSAWSHTATEQGGGDTASAEAADGLAPGAGAIFRAAVQGQCCQIKNAYPSDRPPLPFCANDLTVTASPTAKNMP